MENRLRVFKTLEEYNNCTDKLYPTLCVIEETDEIKFDMLLEVTFKFGEEVYSFNFINGMTLLDFLNSEYNTIGISYDETTYDTIYICYNSIGTDLSISNKVLENGDVFSFDAPC